MSSPLYDKLDNNIHDAVASNLDRAMGSADEIAGGDGGDAGTNLMWATTAMVRVGAALCLALANVALAIRERNG